MFNFNYVKSRGSSKTGLEMFYILEQLKNDAESEEEKQYFEHLQKEWSDFCVGLTLRALR